MPIYFWESPKIESDGGERQMKTQKIETIRKRFKEPEWLLIRVEKIDESTTTPLTGRLIAHNPDPDVIMKKQLKGKGLLFVEYSSDRLPRGYAAAF